MAILQSCCCWQSVRKGSYASALYAMTYYTLCFITMGITVHHDLEYYWKKNNTSSVKPKNHSFLEPVEISSITMIYYVVTLVLSSLGILTSILLVVALHFEIRFLLVPWMLIVSTSSFVDLSHSVYWLSLDDPDFNPVTAILFTTEVFVILLNMYAVLCVFSQYQEYKAGRGTADYDTLLETIRRREQVPPPSIRCSQQQATGTSYLTGTSHCARELCPPSEFSIQNIPVSVETMRSRKVQFTSDGQSNVASSSKNEIDILPEMVSEHAEEHATMVNQNLIEQVEEDEEEDDFVAGRSEYLWCEAADERNLITELMVPVCEDKRNQKKKNPSYELSVHKSDKSPRKKH